MIPYFYSAEMVAAVASFSPSAGKPRVVAEAFDETGLAVRVRPEPVLTSQLHLAHHPRFVNKVLAGKLPNGFGTRGPAVAESCRWTCGAMLSGARHALATGKPVAALCSGFHHACYAHAAGFCTFNGLMVTALSLQVPRVAIVDADFHYGDGTDDILERLGWSPSGSWARLHSARVEKWVFHYSFGKDFHQPRDGGRYLRKMASLREDFGRIKPDIILYQAGADAHADDPLGGVLSTDGLLHRDYLLFEMARDLGVPVCWNLAGGYQVEKDGTIPKVVEIHVNTLKAAAHAMAKAA